MSVVGRALTMSTCAASVPSNRILKPHGVRAMSRTLHRTRGAIRCQSCRTPWWFVLALYICTALMGLELGIIVLQYLRPESNEWLVRIVETIRENYFASN